MSAPRMTEATVDLMMAALKAEMPGALVDVRADRADAKVSTEAVKSWFITEKAQGYQLPAVFIIAEEFDFMKGQHRANHINGIARIYVTTILEDQDTTILTRRAWRYSSAVHQILDQRELTSADLRVKIAVVITRTTYGPMLVKEDSPEGPFRKEVRMECEVNHWESV